MKLGDMMKAYRAEHKYTLRDFAEVCGISFAQVRLMEKGENTHGGQLTPSIKSLKAVAKGMGISLTTLLENCDDMEIEWEADDAWLLLGRSGITLEGVRRFTQHGGGLGVRR